MQTAPALTLARNYDHKAIRSIFLTPGIWECISDPGCGLPFEFDVENEIYLIGEVSGELVGMFVIDGDKETCHIQVIPKHRKQWATIFGKKCLQWCKDNRINKLRALIPVEFPNVKDFAVKCGFKVNEGNEDYWRLEWESSEK